VKTNKGYICVGFTWVNYVETGFKPVSEIDADNQTGIQMGNQTGYKPVSTRKKTGLFEIVRALKTFSARRINDIRDTRGIPVWQSRFYDRIIRDDEDLLRIRLYITENPSQWAHDEENVSTK